MPFLDNFQTESEIFPVDVKTGEGESGYTAITLLHRGTYACTYRAVLPEDRYANIDELARAFQLRRNRG